jgi:hypothetical protein
MTGAYSPSQALADVASAGESSALILASYKDAPAAGTDINPRLLSRPIGV